MKTKIYVGGTFDCFHTGHANLLKQARGLADQVIVAVNSDAFAESYKGKTVMNESERLNVVRACRYVDLCFITESHASQRTYIEIVRPNFILHGDDWKGDSLVRQLALDDDLVRELGIEFKYVPYTSGISTTEIKKRIMKMVSVGSD